MQLLPGNNLDLIKGIQDNSIDAIVTDPPYGLGKEPDALPMLAAWLSNGHYDHSSNSGFMGKTWDAFVPQPLFWKECLRVLKPGGHILTFGGTRTYDLVTLGLRIAGFEIRDVLQWVYGSGFPKSLDVGKAIEKVNGSGWQGYGTALKPAYEPIIMARKPLEGTVAQNVLKWGTGGINIDGCRVGTDEDTRRNARGGDNGLIGSDTFKIRERFASDKEQPSGRFPANLIHDGSEEVLQRFPNAPGQQGDLIRHNHSSESRNGIYGKMPPKNDAIKRGDSGSAARFFYCAKASRAERDEGLDNEKWLNGFELITDFGCFTDKDLFVQWEKLDQNQSIALNGEALLEKGTLEVMTLELEDNDLLMLLNGKNITALFPTAIRFTTLTGIKKTIELKTLNFYRSLNTNDCTADVIRTATEGGLNLVENVGLKNILNLIFIKGTMGFPLGVKIVVNKTQQKISVREKLKMSNIHNTVKPLALMRYLCRLITPPNGTILDPYMGSGTTGVAAKAEGFNFVGMEMEEQYFTIAQTRINNATPPIEEQTPQSQLSLF